MKIRVYVILANRPGFEKYIYNVAATAENDVVGSILLNGSGWGFMKLYMSYLVQKKVHQLQPYEIDHQLLFEI